MKWLKRSYGTANALTDTDLSQVEGGAKVATIHLHAEVPNRVETTVGADGSYAVTANGDARLSTYQDGDGVRVNVVAS
ncbi:MAG: hypothetical protein SPF89_05320 [Sphaerochaetaceae bacterium]|nr:hypothetical protein [Spirochaetales bacterium]MDY5499506.1 hypothetical protein [Sphaerochaetaceae bacterium]